MQVSNATSALDGFHAATREWFTSHFSTPTAPQLRGWPHLLARESTLILAPTGSGKTLTAFLHCIDRLMFSAPVATEKRCRVLYVSPIKALAIDVERNLQQPIAGIAKIAQQRGDTFSLPQVSIRTGDTPQKERARFLRHSADVLITTPESLFLLLTSQARESLRHVETVILDEIHVLVPSKRGAHLALSLERLEQLVGRPIQRIGLSATQRPLSEVARYLGGATVRDGVFTERPVTIVDAAGPKSLELSVEVPVEDLSKLAQQSAPVGPDGGPPKPMRSLWQAIHPRLLELIRSHTSTLMFVNNRRSAERLSAALNELAGEPLVSAHHGSLAKEQRALIETQLKAGTLKGLVATSSLELGIDMGAIDLVIQIEAPPSVASGLQRIGRASHQVGATSKGVIVPKYRGDLIACAALTAAMREGQVEATHVPRSPLDVLAQQLVAIVGMQTFTVSALFDLIRGAASFRELTRAQFEAVLDMLSGHYPSDEFAELRPRLTWNRTTNTLTAREGAKRTAIVNGGTIPDRGLYGVFLSGAAKGQARVGELDEEMVFESKVGDTFVLGASSWRIEEITFDKVMVSPAPGQPGRLPFWRGDLLPRPLEFGRRIGALISTLRGLDVAVAVDLLVHQHSLDERAARNLIAYLHDQAQVSAVPDDKTVVIERGRDDVGDFRICVMSPLGGQILAPWSMAVAARVRRTLGLEVETQWTNDGFIIRFPDTPIAPDRSLFLPSSAEVEALVIEQLANTQLFAARFRENASRALLLPKRRPGQRTPLWQLRKRSQDLLRVASQYPNFPIVMETYRECLAEVFDMPALIDTLRQVETGAITVAEASPGSASPFASALLFGYVANYIYDGDAPPAERRAQALTIDTQQLKELLGEGELRALLDDEVLQTLEGQLQHLTEWKVRSADQLHDLLITLGDLSSAEIDQRCEGANGALYVAELLKAERVIQLTLHGETRFIAVEYAARYRDAFGVSLPAFVPAAFLKPAPEALSDVVLRFARTHGPITVTQVVTRYGLNAALFMSTLQHLTSRGLLTSGAFRPGGVEPEWVDPSVLNDLRTRSLVKLRRAVEPVSAEAFSRFLLQWHGVTQKKHGLDALLDVIERLQGLPIQASILEKELINSRLEHSLRSDLDALFAAGEVVWVGIDSSTDHDGRIALYLTDALPTLHRLTPVSTDTMSDRAQKILVFLTEHGASHFTAIHQAVGGGFAQGTTDALWQLAWRGLITNDGFQVLRERAGPLSTKTLRTAELKAFRSRRSSPVSSEGRWSLVSSHFKKRVTDTEWSAATAQQLLTRYGLVTREAVLSEEPVGGFASLAPVFRTLEESGRIRRGYFVNGVSAMQFALPHVLDALREKPSTPVTVLLSSVDPANAYGALLPWPLLEGAPKTAVPKRQSGSHVLLHDGAALAWFSKNCRAVIAWLPEEPDRREHSAQLIAVELKRLAFNAQQNRGAGLQIETVNGVKPSESILADALSAVGFLSSSKGLTISKRRRPD